MSDTGISPICCRDELSRHVLAHCPLLKELGFKLVCCPPASPAPVPLATAPSPSGMPAATDASYVSNTMGLASTLSGLTAVVALVLDSDADYDSGVDFCWEGDKYETDFGVAPPNLNKSFAPYSFPSCSHIQAKITPSPSSLPSCSQVQVRCSTALSTCLGSPTSRYISHPVTLLRVLDKLALLPILMEVHSRFVAAGTSATNHMQPDKTCFISYKSILNLVVCMGNNSFIPVLDRGMAIFSLNGKHILIRNALHDPGLAIALPLLERER
jgi:hypothetical protein